MRLLIALLILPGESVPRLLPMLAIAIVAVIATMSIFARIDQRSPLSSAAASASAASRDHPLASPPQTPVAAFATVFAASTQTYRLPAAGGTITFRLAAAGRRLRTASLSAALSAPGIVQFHVWQRSAWRLLSLDEAGDRDRPGFVTAVPIAVDTGSARLQVSVSPALGNKSPLVLRITSAETTSASEADRFRACTDACGPVRITPSSVRPSSSSYAIGSSPSVSGVAQSSIVSRAAWGCPDGEASPNWIPFYQQPFHIVIHHTASPPGPHGSIADVQDVWSYHANGRGWGDIGYNYVIDEQGRIFEGRAGGDGSVGGHTHDFNYGSVGIALIGDYSSAEPSRAMVSALIRLVTSLSNRYGIDPMAVATQEGVSFPTIAGHRDLNPTDCPGKNVYSLLQLVRRQAAQAVRSDARLVAPARIYVPSGSPTFVRMNVRNAGTTTWNARFAVRRISGALFGLPAGFNVPNVVPGGSITVPLYIPSLRAGASYTSRWQLIDALGRQVGRQFSMRIVALRPGASTPTPVRTPSRTATRTPTSTRVRRTPTRTATRVRPSATRTPGRPTNTATRTPARPSSTVTPSSTRTASPTRTVTATRTATASRTVTASRTRTRTATPTRTLTPVATATDTASRTATPTVTASPTATASASLTATTTETVSPTVSIQPGVALAPASREQSRAPHGSAPGAIRSNSSAANAGAAGDSSAEVASAVKASSTLLTGAERLYWYFAEGSSFRDDRETIAFINPGPAIAYVLTQLIRADGHRLYVVTDVPPFGRGTLDAGFAAGDGDLLAAIVRSNVPIVAERTVYHGSITEEGTGSALTGGIPAPSHVWYLPRLKIAGDEIERIAILNPNQTVVRAYVSFVRNGRLQTPTRLMLQPLSVIAVGVPGGVTSAVVTSTASGGGIVAEERTLYSRQRGYTVLEGINAAVTDTYLPSPGAGGAHDFLMILNPNNAPVSVALNVVGRATTSGRRITIPARSQGIQRLNGNDIGDNGLLHIHASRPVAIAYAGLLPPSTESSLARTYRGSVVANSTEPALVHVFAEGDSRASLSDPQEILLLANPNTVSARVTVTMLSTGSRRTIRSAVVPAGRTIRIGITGWGPAAQHGLVVIANAPIVAARSIDFNQLTNRLLSYGAM